MTIITNIGTFPNWFSVMKEMEYMKIEKVKVEEALCFGNSTRLGGIPGELTLEEVRKQYRAETEI